MATEDRSDKADDRGSAFRWGVLRMVYIRANELRYLALHLLIVFAVVFAVIVPLVVNSNESFGYALFIAFDFAVTIFCLRWWCPPLFDDTLTFSDRFDVTIDDRGIGGPIRAGTFGFARQEVVPVDRIDLTRCRYNTMFGSYLALKDGRRLIVSSFAHSAENVRRVFEEVRRRVEK